MAIDWVHFTPISASIGGLLIGLAAAMLLLLNGRIAGISGIIGTLLRPVRGDIFWRVTFVIGLIAAPTTYRFFAPLPEVQISASFLTVALAGGLVGIGTRYGAGCTSGHGVCGISRLSLRSLIATLVFMAAGFVTVFVLRHLVN